MKILWHSNAAWAGTGYGTQSALTVSRLLEAGHDVGFSAFWGLNGSTLTWDGIPIYPGDGNWGNRMLPAYAAQHAGTDNPADCLVITLMDVWPLRNDHFKDMWMASWVPVDHDPVPPAVFQYFNKYGAEAVAMSRFGQKALQDQGVPALYVPHSVDTSVFHPTGDSATVRQAMDVPDDAFLVGMVANNKGTTPARKGFPEALVAFREFLKIHDDAYLYIHADKQPDDGLHLPITVAQMGVPQDRVIYAPQMDYLKGTITPEAMAQLYSAFDVLLNPAWGEGFGIPIIEAQACGTPVITSNWTAMPEVSGVGWLVEGEPFYNAPQGSYWLHPHVGSIVDALKEAYDAPDLSSKAVEFASQYDADRVFAEHWLPTLDTLVRRA